MSAFLNFSNFEDFKSSQLPGLLNMSTDVFSPRSSSTNDEEWGTGDDDDDNDQNDDQNNFDDKNEVDEKDEDESDAYQIAMNAAVAAAASIREDASKKINELF